MKKRPKVGQVVRLASGSCNMVVEQVNAPSARVLKSLPEMARTMVSVRFFSEGELQRAEVDNRCLVDADNDAFTNSDLIKLALTRCYQYFTGQFADVAGCRELVRRAMNKVVDPDLSDEVDAPDLANVLMRANGHDFGYQTGVEGSEVNEDELPPNALYKEGFKEGFAKGREEREKRQAEEKQRKKDAGEIEPEGKEQEIELSISDNGDDEESTK
jgi:hypothetical protein